MDKDRLVKLKEEAEAYIKTLQEDQLKATNGIQQILGRIQMLNELIEAESADAPSEEVADKEEPALPSDS